MLRLHVHRLSLRKALQDSLSPFRLQSVQITVIWTEVNMWFKCVCVCVCVCRCLYVNQFHDHKWQYLSLPWTETGYVRMQYYVADCAWNGLGMQCKYDTPCSTCGCEPHITWVWPTRLLLLACQLTVIVGDSDILWSSRDVGNLSAMNSWGNLSGKRVHTQLVGEHKATVVSARRWATVDWSWNKERD